MVSTIESMIARLHGSDFLERVQRTPLSELRKTLDEVSESQSIPPRDGQYFLSSSQVNQLLDEAIGYKN